jgi:glyoxylase-like metal-dependent hydrolase (beta-lactamase superfamily II)
MHEMPIEVAPGVHHILLGLPGEGLTVNVFVLRDADGRFVLIDTGWRNPMYLAVIDEGLKALGGSLEEVAQVIVTHGHPDHAGGASAIQRVSKATVFLGRDDEPLLQRTHSPGRMQEFASFMDRHGMPADDFMSQAHAGFSQQWTMMEDEPQAHIEHPPDELESVGLQAVWTPGHSPGHACYWMPSTKVMFSGDHVLPHITPNVSMMGGADVVGNPLGDYIKSLDKVCEYPAKQVLPAHGPMFTDLKARVNEIMEHHHVRTDEVMATLEGAKRSAVEVASGVTWKQSPFEQLPMMHQRMAVGETLAHLRYLVVEGHVNETTDGDGRVFFSIKK